MGVLSSARHFGWCKADQPDVAVPLHKLLWAKSPFPALRNIFTEILSIKTRLRVNTR